MNDIVQNMQASYGVFENLFHQMLAFLPSLIGFVLFLLLAWLFYKFFVWLVSRILNSIRLDHFFQKKFPGIETWKFRLRPTSIILVFTKMTLLLIFVVLGSEILGLPVLSQELAKLLNFLPRVVIAVALIFLGFNISGAARNLIFTVFNSFGLTGAKLISTIAGYIILFVVLLIATELIGIDTSIITNNLSILLGAILLCITLAVGLGSVEIVKRILFGFYFKKNFNVGQVIEFDTIRGKIIKMDNINVVLQRQNDKLVIPIRDLIDARVSIVDRD
ncbi:mechanosensitive ion channel [Algoriphagus sp. AGSA1]|uniref:mechanosensitive ion channel family protein n=1 Tax=Algoriphagus sp. AGSA1 TaxID=2907213 RepID=UPI001F1B1AFB|nr:mechanosensitive ion channel [Algoriphagus sp. AGSA1]MCE7056101.1 mechanosensitive ion channel [Algoriphagus sp. AGSA1]